MVRVVACNPGKFTLNGTNTYLVGTGRRRILVDTGEGRPAYIALLRRAMRETGCEDLEAILCTHRHYDHIGGLESIYEALGRQVPTFKCRREGREWRHYRYNAREPSGVTFLPLEDGQVIRTEGATLRTVLTPGHSEDHACFLLVEEPSLFAGDNILGYGSSWFEVLDDYMASLRRMAQLIEQHSPGFQVEGE